ncbi:pyridoxal-phosphate dependent enzyme [Haliangium sp.]|uniref:pyridoxal-phosphate dependent enzyme n=1 Tax=Haliangium sp. TaxID=2663208 RepID=UPI003D142B56
MSDTGDVSAEALLGSTVECAGCGHRADDGDAEPFRCPAAAAGDATGGRDNDVDHVMTVRLDLAGTAFPSPDTRAQSPFLRFRRLHHAWRLARRRGLGDQDYLDLVSDLDDRVAAAWGHGFAPASLSRVAPIALGLDRLVPGAELWLLDESGGVAGSHKARHLMGLALHLAVVERAGLGVGGHGSVSAGDAGVTASVSGRPLAIASCGNAALAAAVIARAAERPLQVFVPPWAEPAVVTRLRALGADIVTCPRGPDDPPGDPCYHRFLAAVDAGALPFACQGNQNGLTIEGGRTLGWELAGHARDAGADGFDHLALQVGGGALASSVIQGLRVARELGVITHLPAVHAVQTQGAHPLWRAWRRAALGAAKRVFGQSPELVLGAAAAPDAEPDLHADAALARALAGPSAGHPADRSDHPAVDAAIRAQMRHARTHRGHYMWPWEREPASVATGILDDETYDWAVIVEAMLATGGWPVVVADELFIEARDRARAALGVPVSATGAAGLAGLLALGRAGLVSGPGDRPPRLAALLTGVEHDADSPPPAPPPRP